MGKLNEVKKVTTMGSSETVPILLADGSIGQIPLSSLSTALADVMRTQSIEKNGLMPNGLRATLTTSNKDTTKIVIGYKWKTHNCTLLAAGHYSNPTIYLLNLGMYGGNPSGHPHSLKITRLSGPVSIVSGKAFIRNDKSCIELTFSASIRYTAISALDFRAALEFISNDESMMYSETTDTLMKTATIE